MRRFALLATCAAAALAAPARAQQAPIPLRLGTVTGDELTPLLYAQSTGLFRRAGLDVQMVLAPSGAQVVSALLAGTYDIGKSSVQSLINAYIRGLPIVLVAAGGVYDARVPYEQLVVAPDSPIRSGRDLNGKVIAVPALNDLNTVSIQAWVDQTGGDASTLKFVEFPATATGAAIAEHRVDAGMISNLALGAALQAGHVKVVAPVKNAIAPRFLNSAWVATTTWAASHADVLRTFVRTMGAAARYTNAHPAETVTMIADATKIPIDVVRTMPRAIAGTSLSAAEIQPLVDAASKYKLIAHGFRAQEMIFTDPRAK